MRVLLCRHAHAVDESDHLTDESRYLSAKGRQVARDAGARLRARGLSIDAAVTSPLVRAVQTAELVALGLEWSGVIESLEFLAPGGSIRSAAAEISARGTSVLVVGHEPSISALGALLTRRPKFPPLDKGQVWLLDPGTGSLELAS